MHSSPELRNSNAPEVVVPEEGLEVKPEHGLEVTPTAGPERAYEDGLEVHQAPRRALFDRFYGKRSGSQRTVKTARDTPSSRRLSSRGFKICLIASITVLAIIALVLGIILGLELGYGQY